MNGAVDHHQFVEVLSDIVTEVLSDIVATEEQQSHTFHRYLDIPSTLAQNTLVLSFAADEFGQQMLLLKPTQHRVHGSVKYGLKFIS